MYKTLWNGMWKKQMRGKLLLRKVFQKAKMIKKKHRVLNKI